MYFTILAFILFTNVDLNQIGPSKITINSMFKYQDHVIEYVEVFERIDKCTEEIMVNFKLEGVPIIGFLSNQNVILGNSLEIDCRLKIH
jgi:hypothetical protein